MAFCQSVLDEIVLSTTASGRKSNSATVAKIAAGLAAKLDAELFKKNRYDLNETSFFTYHCAVGLPDSQPSGDATPAAPRPENTEPCAPVESLQPPVLPAESLQPPVVPAESLQTPVLPVESLLVFEEQPQTASAVLESIGVGFQPAVEDTSWAESLQWDEVQPNTEPAAEPQADPDPAAPDAGCEHKGEHTCGTDEMLAARGVLVLTYLDYNARSWTRVRDGLKMDNALGVALCASASQATSAMINGLTPANRAATVAYGFVDGGDGCVTSSSECFAQSLYALATRLRLVGFPAVTAVYVVSASHWLPPVVCSESVIRQTMPYMVYTGEILHRRTQPVFDDQERLQFDAPSDADISMVTPIVHAYNLYEKDRFKVHTEKNATFAPTGTFNRWVPFVAYENFDEDKVVQVVKLQWPDAAVSVYNVAVGVDTIDKRREAMHSITTVIAASAIICSLEGVEERSTKLPVVHAERSVRVAVDEQASTAGSRMWTTTMAVGCEIM